MMQFAAPTMAFSDLILEKDDCKVITYMFITSDRCVIFAAVRWLEMACIL